MLRLIQHQSSTDRNRQRLIANLNHNFDRSKNRFDQSKFWKNQFFEKTQHFYAETPQTIELYKTHAWVWDEMCFKNTCFKPSSPKIKIFNPFSLDSQASNMFCIKLKEFFKLGWSNQKHTQLHVQCLAKSNLCCVCN